MVDVASRLAGHVADKRLTRDELLDTAVSMLDGEGVTRTEKSSLKKSLDKIFADDTIVSTEQVREAAALLCRRLNSFSATKGVHAPGITSNDIAALMTFQVGYDREPGEFTKRNETDLPDPRLPLSLLDARGLPKAEKARFRGKLFGKDGPKVRDVGQGYLSNCYMGSAAAALAHCRPDLVESLFSERPDGIVDVWFHDGAQAVDRDLYVDDDLPLFGQSPISQSRTKMPMWFPLLEKAWATEFGSYFALDEGGWADEFIVSLVGGSIDYTDLEKSSAGDVWRTLQKAEKNEWPVTVSSLDAKFGRRYSGTELVTEHSYACLGTSVKAGVKMVKLYNPWGSGEPSGNGADDGIFELELKDFMRLMRDFSVVELAKS